MSINKKYPKLRTTRFKTNPNTKPSNSLKMLKLCASLALKPDLILWQPTYMPKIESTGNMVQKLWLRNTENFMLFDVYDLDFDPITLIFKIDLNNIVTHILTKAMA